MSAAAARAPRGMPIDAWRLAALEVLYAGLDGTALLRPLLMQEFAGRIAVVSSLGAESVVLLSLVAEIDPRVPVIFLDTGKHFAETLAYRDRIAARLGLENLCTVRPAPLALAAEDADGTLWRAEPERCCALRKVVPLERALEGFEAWITGRKRYHGGARASLGTFELADGRIKVNPLARWTASDIAKAFTTRDLPRHPLVALGFGSIGCAPCTAKTRPGAGVRSGRWPGQAKTECGIHRTDEPAGA